jgi:hypothetical protein
MTNARSTQRSSEVDRTAEVQGYFTPIPIPLPNPDAPTAPSQTLPASVRSFSRSLGSIAILHPVPLPGVIDPPNPVLG